MRQLFYYNNIIYNINVAFCRQEIPYRVTVDKGLGAIRAKIGPTSDVDKIFFKMYSQYVLFRNKYS